MNNEQCKEELQKRLDRLGFKAGDLQWKWRTEKNLHGSPDEIDAAILDALINMGGAVAWSGDGSSCAVQIVQNILEERDHYKEELEQMKEEAWKYKSRLERTDCRNAGPFYEMSGSHCPIGKLCDRCERERETDYYREVLEELLQSAKEAEAGFVCVSLEWLKEKFLK